MAILVTGGAGYIGSVTVDVLLASGEAVVVLDDLARGHRAAVNESAALHVGKIGDRELIARIAREHRVEECVHFAALAYVGESVAEPRRYFESNIGEGLGLIGALLDAGVRRIVFSSTCATYGEPDQVPIPETQAQSPANPYGWSKLLIEAALGSYASPYGLRSVSLRYFNAAGATERLGEHHEPESHLIPILLQTALGQRSHVSIFGDDYETPDGTAIRDYIHVGDLALAHLAALRYLREGGDSTALNLGTGRGHSVLEVLQAARSITGHAIEARREGRRVGDPARLVADPSRAQSMLGWRPKTEELDAIVQSAWDWHRKHPDGYES